MPHCAAGSPDCSSLSESPGRSSCPATSRLRRSLLLCAVALMTMAPSAKALPANPRWVNPCDLPGHVFDPNTDMEGAPPIPKAVIFRNVHERAFEAKIRAQDVTRKFLEAYFPDPAFVTGTSSYRQQWLPKIPPPNEENFKNITDREALKKSFEFLQFFAVGLEQIILDQTLHEGRFLAAYQNLENNLTQVLCELQLGLFSLRVSPSADVLRDVMSKDYRDVRSRSIRYVRDYLILRDFVTAADFVAQLFGYLEDTL